MKSESLRPGRDATIWISKKCHLSLGEYEVNGESGVKSKLEKITNISFNSKEICIAIFNKPASYDIKLYIDPSDEDKDDTDDKDKDNNENDIEKKKNMVFLICIACLYTF